MKPETKTEHEKFEGNFLEWVYQNDTLNLATLGPVLMNRLTFLYSSEALMTSRIKVTPYYIIFEVEREVNLWHTLHIFILNYKVEYCDVNC